MLLSLLCCVGEQKVVFKVPPEPSLDFEVAGHLLGEGAVCDVRRLEPLAELGHSEDAFVGHPAPGVDSRISRGGGGEEGEGLTWSSHSHRCSPAASSS